MKHIKKITNHQEVIVEVAAIHVEVEEHTKGIESDISKDNIKITKEECRMVVKVNTIMMMLKR